MFLFFHFFFHVTKALGPRARYKPATGAHEENIRLKTFPPHTRRVFVRGRHDV